MITRRQTILAGGAALAAAPGAAFAGKAYDPGASDSEIRIGQTAPFSGPASLYATVSRAISAYFAMVNEAGGVNGRKLTLLARDDSFSPPKTVELTRQLVEQDNVLFIYQTLGTATNTVIQRYLNGKKIPQLYISTGAAKWNDPAQYPWTLASYPNNRTEAKIYGAHIRKTNPSAKVGILYQNDDFGKDYLEGLRDGLGDRAAAMLVTKASYELSDPNLDSQVIALRHSGAETLLLAAFAKQTTQALRKIGELGWKPATYVTWASSSIPTVLTPAGLDNAVGLITSAVVKDSGDPRWQNDPDMVAYKAWMKKYYPQGNPDDMANVWPYAVSSILVQVLEKCGDTLTRQNILKQATTIGALTPPLFLPGIVYHVTPTDYDAIKTMQLQRFDGKQWAPLGDPIRG